MHSIINFNGQLVNREMPVVKASNRSLRYGDGLYETMYWNGSSIKRLDFHLDRLFHGLEVLRFDLSDGNTRNAISNQIINLCLKNAGANSARVRLNVFRQDSDFLKTDNNKPEYIIESTDLSTEPPKPVSLCLFKKEKKSTGLLSNLKTNNYLLFILALQEANNMGFDDALILNTRDNCCETSSSNLFVVRDDTVFTPALSEGCVAGTKRRDLLEILPALGFSLIETAISLDFLKTADEVFLTNAIRGIQTVSRVNDQYYRSDITEKIMNRLNE